MPTCKWEANHIFDWDKKPIVFHFADAVIAAVGDIEVSEVVHRR